MRVLTTPVQARGAAGHQGHQGHQDLDFLVRSALKE